MLLANSWITFPIKSNLVFSHGLKNLPRSSPDCPSFCKWVSDNFILADQPFAKALQNHETCVVVNNDLCS